MMCDHHEIFGFDILPKIHYRNGFKPTRKFAIDMQITSATR